MELIELGVGGIFAILILQIVFNFIKKRNGKDKNITVPVASCVMASKEFKEYRSEVKDMKEKVHHMNDMHNKYDENGTPLWYMPRGYAHVQEKMLTVLTKIDSNQTLIAETLRRIEAKL